MGVKRMTPRLVSVRRHGEYWVATVYELDGARLRPIVRVEGPEDFAAQAARSPERFAVLAVPGRRGGRRGRVSNDD